MYRNNSNTLLCKQITFDFMSQMILIHFLPMPMTEKCEYKGHQIIKNSFFDQNFVSGPTISKNPFLTISRPLRMFCY